MVLECCVRSMFLQMPLVGSREACQMFLGHLTLSWPAAETGFLLERATTLPASTWQPAGPPVVAGDLFSVTLPLDGESAIFRLRQP